MKEFEDDGLNEVDEINDDAELVELSEDEENEIDAGGSPGGGNTDHVQPICQFKFEGLSKYVDINLSWNGVAYAENNWIDTGSIWVKCCRENNNIINIYLYKAVLYTMFHVSPLKNYGKKKGAPSPVTLKTFSITKRSGGFIRIDQI